MRRTVSAPSPCHGVAKPPGPPSPRTGRRSPPPLRPRPSSSGTTNPATKASISSSFTFPLDEDPEERLHRQQVALLRDQAPEQPPVGRLERARDLLRLDLDDLVADRDLVPFGHQPAHHRPLLHGEAPLRHHDRRDRSRHGCVLSCDGLAYGGRDPVRAGDVDVLEGRRERHRGMRRGHHPHPRLERAEDLLGHRGGDVRRDGAARVRLVTQTRRPVSSTLRGPCPCRSGKGCEGR